MLRNDLSGSQAFAAHDKERVARAGRRHQSQWDDNPRLSPRRIDDGAGQRKFRYSLLDGINRLDAMDAVGIKFAIVAGKSECPTIEIEGDFDRSIPEPVIIDGIEVDPDDFVLSANIRRRHLNATQKKNLIIKVLKAQPNKSNRQVAMMAGVSHPHVGAVRTVLEQSGDVDELPRRSQREGPQAT